MEEKIQKEQLAAKKNLPKKLWWMGAVAVLAVIAAVMVIMGGSAASGEGKVSCMKIDTPYIDLLLPMELEKVVTSDESTYGDIYTRAFYMHFGEKNVPLWRLDFGDPDAGTWVGLLKTDKGDVPVTMTGFVISDEEMVALGEEGYQLYSRCMDGYSVMLEGICTDSRYTSERPLTVGENTKMKLTYWNITLPDTMSVSEKTEESFYEAKFFGEVIGENVALYRISIGEEKAEVPLGYYEVDGVKKPVYVESFELSDRDNWSEDDYAAAYRMMDTINHVIETIMQSSQFSAEAE